MKLTDLVIRAWDGGILVEGELAIHAASGGTVVRSPSPGTAISVRTRGRGFGQTAFSIVDKGRREPDGLYGAGRLILTVNFEETIADPFSWLQITFKGGQQRISTDGLRLMNVHFEEPERGFHHFHGDTLHLALAVEPGGLRIAFRGCLRSAADDRDPMFHEAELTGDMLLPSAWCILQSFHLPPAFLRGDESEAGAWKPEPGLGMIAVNRSGMPFCPGMLDMGEKGRGDARTGPWVETYMFPREMRAQPAGDLVRLRNGFAAESRYTSGGPELRLYLGFEDWERILAGAEEATLRLAGSGIGHADGVTGREGYENPRRQAITMLDLCLRRTDEGLLLKGEGTLAPLIADEKSPGLGPALRFAFLIPRAWILARGLPLTGFFQDRTKEFANVDTLE